jgi:hypothetical protein
MTLGDLIFGLLSDHFLFPRRKLHVKTHSYRQKTQQIHDIYITEKKFSTKNFFL